MAIFGFPQEDGEQADKATRHALSILESFEKLRDNGSDDAFKRFDVHVGVSSGSMIVAPRAAERKCAIANRGRASRAGAAFLHREPLLRHARADRAAHL